MRADECAVVALDAGLGVPSGNGDRNAALLVCGGTLAELAVNVIHECGYGQAVAVHQGDGLHDAGNLLDQGGIAFQLLFGSVVDRVRPIGGNVHLHECGCAGLDGAVVHVHHVLALLQVGLGCSILHVLDRFFLGHDLGQGEKCRLQDGVGALAHADFAGEVDGVDGVQLNVVFSDVALCLGAQMLGQLFGSPLAVDHQDAAGLYVTDDGEALGDVRRYMAGYEVGLVDVVGAADEGVAEAQVAYGYAAGLLGVVLEVCLYVLVGVVANNLDGVLVRTDGTVAADTPELALDGACRRGVGAVGVFRQGQVGDVVDDADGELALGLVLLQLVEDGKYGSGRGVLGTQTVAAAGDGQAGNAFLGQGAHDVLIQGLAQGAGLLGAVHDGDLLDGLGQGLDELRGNEGTVQADLDQADLFAIGVQVVDDFFGNVAEGAHGDDDAVGIGCAVVVEQLVVGAQLGVDLVHVLFDDGRQVVVHAIACLAVLEEDVAVFVGTAHCGMLGVQGVGAERTDRVHVNHLGQVVIVPNRDLLDFVGGAEAVEEVQEGNAALDGCQVGNRAQVHDFLDVAFGQHCETGLAACHDVGMVAEDVQRMGCQGTRANVEDGGHALCCDLVHVGDHQQQALGCGVGGGQRAGGQRAVYSTRGTALALHLADLDGRAEDVLLALGRPLVHEVSHGAGGSDRIDAGNLGERIRHVGRSVVAVHRLVNFRHFLSS